MFKTYTDRRKRCCLCRGRNVLVLDTKKKKIVSSSLEKMGDKWLCKDKVECNANIQAENTELEIEANENTFKYSVNGHNILEVTKK